jgi:hypothetical protein
MPATYTPSGTYTPAPMHLLPQAPPEHVWEYRDGTWRLVSKTRI